MSVVGSSGESFPSPSSKTWNKLLSGRATEDRRWRERSAGPLLLLTRIQGSGSYGVEQALVLGLAPRAGQRSSVGEWASVERIGSPLAIAELEQGRVVTPNTVAEHQMD